MKRIFDKIPNEISLSGLASRPWLIVPVCSLLHLTYAAGLLIDEKVYKITALHLAEALLGRGLFCALVGVALIALVPMVMKMEPKTTHLYLLPQQCMLFLMAVSAILASISGVYPDGYEASHAFILADQSFTIWLMLGHLAALIRNARFASGTAPS
jgi:hypothetical protein